MLTALRRIVRSGGQKFMRDRSASTASLVTMTIVLILLSLILFLRGFNDFLVTSLQDRITIGAYLQDTATEEEIMQIKADLESRSEVKAVEYISEEAALEDFKKKHENDPRVLDAISAVGGNPLPSSLKVHVWDPDMFLQVVQYIENASYAPLIAEVDYHDRASVIERITNIIGGVRTIVFAIIGLGALIAVLVTFNTTRLAIYNSREEVSVMRLVGASNWFIRGPFVVQGIIVGAFATVITVVILGIAVLLLNGRIAAFTDSLNSDGFSLWTHFRSNFLLFIFIQFIVGVLLGTISSLAAIRKYLQV